MNKVYVIRHTADLSPTGVYANTDAIVRTLRDAHGEEPVWLSTDAIECAGYEYIVTQHEVIN